MTKEKGENVEGGRENPVDSVGLDWSHRFADADITLGLLGVEIIIPSLTCYLCERPEDGQNPGIPGH